MREDAGRRYVESEVAALELEQAQTDQLASQLETRLRVVMKSGVHFNQQSHLYAVHSSVLLTCLFSCL